MNKFRRLTFISLFAALLGLLSQVMIPLPGGVPLSLQTFAVALCGILLGWGSGVISVSVWLVLGVVGIPLFSGFQGGTAVLFGPTGGFLIGFLPLVLFCGIARPEKRFLYYVFYSVGLFLCHFFGVLWFSFLSGQSFFTAAVTVSLPYFPKDLLSLVAADLCGRGISRVFPFFRKN